MEDVMLGSRRTISFWQPKKRLLSLARALSPNRVEIAREPAIAHVVADVRLKARLALEAKRKGRFREN
jgi:hypothetical protein